MEELPQDTIVTKSALDKKEDLEKLHQCAEAIEQFLACDAFNEKALSQLLKISTGLSELSFNDAGEDCRAYLRNKYGSLDRSHNAQRRPYGLEIIHLTALRRLLEENGLFSRESFELWSADLRCLQKKIHQIIACEETGLCSYDDVMRHFEQLGEAHSITQYVTSAYVTLIIDNMLTLLKDPLMERLDFSLREDRYYLGRVLSIVGELSKELRDFLNPGQESGVFSFFKKVRDDCLAHFFDAMVRQPSDEGVANFGVLKKLLVVNFVEILEHIRNQPERKLGYLNSEEKKELKKVVGSVFFGKAADVDVSIIERIAFVDVVPKEAVNKKEEKEAVVSVNPMMAKAPRSSLDAIKAIPMKANKYESLKASVKPKDVKLRETIKKEITDIIFAFNHAVEEKGFGDLRIPEGESFPTKDETTALLEKIAEREALVFAVSREPKKDKTEPAENVEPLAPTNATVSHSDEAFQGNIDKISKELDFLSSTIQNAGLEEKKKQFIAEFCLSKIGQVFKELDENFSRTLKDKLVNNTPGCFHESVRVTTQTRHKLMHDILARHRLPFFERLFRQTLPLLPEIQALQTVLRSKDFSAQGSAFVNLGRAYAVLKQYDKAFDCFEKMLSVLDLEESQVDGGSSGQEIIEFNATVLNALWGMAEVYGLLAQEEYRKENIESHKMFSGLKIAYLEMYLNFARRHQRYLGKAIASVHNNIANVYSDINEFDKALENHRAAFALLREYGLEDEIRQALYLSNAGITFYHKLLYAKQLPRAEERSAVISLIHHAQLSVACLWWAKTQYEKSGFSKIEVQYIRNLSTLIRVIVLSGEGHRVFPRASEWLQELQDVLRHAPLRADAPELAELGELQELIDKIRNSIDKTQSNSQRLIAQFEAERTREDVGFEMQNLLQLIKFFAEHLGVVQTFENERANIAQKLARVEASPESAKNQFIWGFGQRMTDASLQFMQGHFQQALHGYLELLDLVDQKYSAFKSVVYFADLLESIGDTYFALDQKELGFKYMVNALTAHGEYGPNERAFLIPQKMLKNGCTADFILPIALTALEKFELFEKINKKFLPLVRVLVAAYAKIGQIEKARNLLLRLPPECRSEQDNMVLNSFSSANSMAAFGIHPAPRKTAEKKTKPKKPSRQPTTGGPKSGKGGRKK